MLRRSGPLVLLVLAAFLVAADSSMQPASDIECPKYLACDAIDAVGLLPDPPAAGSVENDREYELLKRAYEQASPREKEQVEAEHEKMDVFVFADLLGESWFNKKHCKHAAAFFAQVATDAKFFSDRAKVHFRRARPSEHGDFKPWLNETSFSYPSGHSTRGMLWAELLAEMYPEKREALLKRGRELGYHRMIAGVHFPTDVYAGRVIGHAVAQSLLANVTVRAEMDQVKAEMDEAKAKFATEGAANAATQK